MKQNGHSNYTEHDSICTVYTLYTVPKNNLILRIKTEPVTDGAEYATVYIYCNWVNKNQTYSVASVSAVTGLVFMPRFRFFVCNVQFYQWYLLLLAQSGDTVAWRGQWPTVLFIVHILYCLNIPVDNVDNFASKVTKDLLYRSIHCTVQIYRYW